MKKNNIKKINLILAILFFAIAVILFTAKVVDSSAIINISNKFTYIGSAPYNPQSQRVAQSFCKVGDYYVCAIIEPNGETKTNTLISVVSAKTGKEVNSFSCFKFEHANGMTYNKDNGNIYISHWTGSSKNLNKVSYFPANLITSKDTNKIKNSIKTITLPEKAASIAYDSYNKRYVTNSNKKVCIYDTNFKLLSSFSKENTNQDICVYKGLILAVEYDETSKYANKIFIYSSKGEYIATLGMTNTNKIAGKKVTNGGKIIEMEGIDVIGDNKLATIFYGNTLTYGNPIFSLSIDLNRYIKGSVKYTIKGLSQENAENISFTVYMDKNSNGKIDSTDKKIKDIVTDENGSFNIQDLEYGKYLLKINSQITGYETKNITNFSISYDGQVVDDEIVFSPKTYIVSYNGNMNTEGTMTPNTFEYDKEYTLKKSTYARKYKVTYDLSSIGGNSKYAIVEYKFKGWNTDSSSKDILYKENAVVKNLKESGRIELYAIWEPGVAILPKPEKVGYTCIGWSTNKNSTFAEYACNTKFTPTKDVILYPIFVGNDYIIEYNGNGSSSGNMGTTLLEVGEYGRLEKNKYIKENRLTLNYNFGNYETKEEIVKAKFKYWNSRADDSGVKYSDEERVRDIIDNPNRKITLYAQWELGKVTLPTPERDGYKCIGWNTYSGATVAAYKCGQEYQVASDVELYAVWESKTYEVKYNGNGSTSGNTLNSKHEIGEESNLSKNNYKKEHTLKLITDGKEEVINTQSTFKYWNSKQDGNGNSYSDSESVMNLTNEADTVVNLYAIWRDEEITLGTPEKKKYECIGWSENPNSENPEYKCGDKISVDENITLYAIFKKVESKYSLNVKINLLDEETKASLDGAIFKIYEYNNEDNSYVEYSGMTKKEDGKYISDIILEYTDENEGKFKIIEEKAPYGYYGEFKENSTSEKKEYFINIEEIIEEGKYYNQKVENKSEIILKDNGNDITNKRTKGDIIVKIISDSKLGEATLDGNKWGIYKNGELISAKEVSNGRINFSDLELGEYTLKEIEEARGFIKDTKEYKVTIEYEGESNKNVLTQCEIVKNVKRQGLKIINENIQENNIENNGYSLEFKAFLISNLKRLPPNIDKENYNFENYDFSSEIPQYEASIENNNTSYIGEIEYGNYVIVNINADDSKKIKPFTIKVDEDSDIPQIWKVSTDNKKIKVELRDKETNEKILKPNAKYVIYNLEKGEYVEQALTGVENIMIGSVGYPFVTDENGEFITPLELEDGRYRIKEISAPEGYILPGYNKVLIDGKYTDEIQMAREININSNIAYRVEDESSNIVVINDYNMPAKGSFKYSVEKEILTNVDTKEYGNYKFQYSNQKLDGIGVNLYAREEILNANDGSVKYKKDELIGTYYTSQNNLIINELDIGKYYIEVTYVNSKKLNETIKTEFDIDYVDDTAAIIYKETFSEIDRNKKEVKLQNINEENQKIEGSTFGIYNIEDISYKTVDGEEKKIIANQLIKKVDTDREGNIIIDSNTDLPAENYYIKQLKQANGYVKNNEVIYINLKNSDKQEYQFVNKYTRVNIQVIDKNTLNGLKDTKLKITNGKGINIEQSTDENGYIAVRGLSSNENIIIEEINAKDGYSKKIINPNQKNIEIKDYNENKVEIQVKDINEVQEIVLKNEVQVVNLEIISKGEIFTGKFNKGKALYNYRDLEGTKFSIYANKDINYPDGKEGVVIKAGTKIATATTKENGKVEISKVTYDNMEKVNDNIRKMLEKGIPCGEYRIVVDKVKNGFYNNEKDEILINLENKDSNETVLSKQLTINSNRQKVNIQINNKTSAGEIIQNGRFGIYTNSEIVYIDENGNENALGKNQLITTKETNENGEVVFSDLDLPLGKYYIKQENTPSGYLNNDGILVLDLSYQENNLESINILKTFINEKEINNDEFITQEALSNNSTIKNSIDITENNNLTAKAVEPSMSDIQIEKQSEIEPSSENFEFYNNHMNETNTSLENFNMKIESYVSEIKNYNDDKKITQNTGLSWDNNLISKTDMKANKIDQTDIIIKYEIKISNTGDCDGYIGKVIDYIPEGLIFYDKDNEGWQKTNENIVENTSLYGSIIKPGEERVLSIYLRWDRNKKQFGEIKNKLEIVNLENEYDLKENNLEDNTCESSTIISIKTNLDESIIYISICGVILMIFGCGILAIKKFVL